MASGPGTASITLAREVAELVWRQHFRIPEPVYWLTLLVTAVGFSTETTLEALGWAGLLALSVVGIARWHWHRRRSRALVIARFSTVRGQEGMAERVQELVMTSLQDKLPPNLLPLVHGVPAVLGTADRGYALRLRRRLRSLYLCMGEWSSARTADGRCSRGSCNRRSARSYTRTGTPGT
jgi:4-amino-4-deoxy-L-arabinose transferase-like glycosyltransferase